MGITGFKIGVLDVGILDILDILIVGLLIYWLYRLLKGSIAFNIFIGAIIFYALYWLVDQMDMSLMSLVLGKFVSFGVIVLIIIFQPEVRRFLLMLGDTTIRRRSEYFNQIFYGKKQTQSSEQSIVNEIIDAVNSLKRQMTGALIIFGKNIDLNELNETGIMIDGKISALMLESIFQKSSPLHDGAVIIHNGRIQSAGCILPISKNPNIPTGAGLRHRAGLGITESTQSVAIIVSEETGETSIAENAKLFVNVSESFVKEKIEKYLN